MTTEIRHFQPGEIIFLSGTSGDEAYLIRAGQVHIYDAVDGQEVTHAVLRPGDIVGEMALVDDRPRSASARADTPVDVVVLPRKLFLHELERTPPIIRRLVEAYVAVIRGRNRRRSRCT